MTQRLLHIEYVVALTILMAASGAAAQEAPVEVAGGYQVHAVRGFPEWGSFYQGSRTFSGWFASAAWNATSNWGLVFEVAERAASDRVYPPRCDERPCRRQASHRAHGGHPGAHRLQHARGRRRNPVPQGDGESETVCATRGRADELRKCRLPPPPPQRYIFHCTPSECVPMPFSDIPTGRSGPYGLLMMWPGGGVDVHLLDRVAVRLQADSVGVISGGISLPRFLVSAVYQIGSR